MATGANTTPLGKLHPILAARLASAASQQTPESQGLNMEGEGKFRGGSKDPELQRHLEAAKRAASALFPVEPARKKRKRRWGSENDKTVLPGLPTTLPANMSEDQQKLYLLHLKIEEIGRMLRTGDLGIPPNPANRSPSPEPIYSHDGKRLNTREVRVRKRLEDERHDCVQQALKLNAEYKPPADYKPPNKKFEDKVFIPQDEHPETNFVGLLIGPRGNTLKQLERETNTKIMIRGKGATKEGKLGRSGLPQPGEDEPLHALITGLTPEAVKNSVDKIKGIIQSGIDVPGNDNDLKKQQLMQLAELNGTFKPLDIFRCHNCGSTSHRSWECHEQQNVTSTIVCTRCGGGGHIASDCKAELPAGGPPPITAMDRAKMDSEYLSLMKELGESVPGGGGGGGGEGKPSQAGMGAGTNVPPPAVLMGSNNPGGVLLPDPTQACPPWMMNHPHPHHHLPHPMMMGHPGAAMPWGGPFAPPMHMHPHVMGAPPPPPPPPTSSPPHSSSTETSQADTSHQQQENNHQQPWQAPLPPHPGMPWQQPMMYPGVPMAPPLPPGVPPPPPPEQSWNGAAPPPPPPPPPPEPAT